MWLGSGTWDSSLGVTYLKEYENMSYGAQTKYLYRIGKNSEGYTLWDKWNNIFWYTNKLSNSFSASLRADYNSIASIDDADKTISIPMLAPVFDASNLEKKQLDVLLGVNYVFFKGVLKGMRLEVEAGLPVYENVKGIQMKTHF